MIAYDWFYDDEIQEAPPLKDRMELSQGSFGWLSVNQAPEIMALRQTRYAGDVSHEIKLSKLEIAQLLTPPQLSSFRLGKVDRTDFFANSVPGILTLRDGKVPRGTVLETTAHTFDPEALRNLPLRDGERTAMPLYYRTDNVPRRVLDLAHDWVGERPYGWEQIQAVIHKLRTEFVHDRLPASLPDESTEPKHLPGDETAMEKFLFETKRGPDFLFATTAAVMLRELGYPTRVIVGFYADPAKYDSVSTHTPVFETDLHFWPEVMLPGDEWVVLEPTPGYDVMPPAQPLLTRLWSMIVASGGWMLEQWPWWTALLVLSAVAVWRRRDVMNGLATCRWRLSRSSTARRHVLTTLWLLERRSAWRGSPRPKGQTPRRWLATRSTEMNGFLDLADWAAYAPESRPSPGTIDEVRLTCQHAVLHWD
jgi:hypothetical protein